MHEIDFPVPLSLISRKGGNMSKNVIVIGGVALGPKAAVSSGSILPPT